MLASGTRFPATAPKIRNGSRLLSTPRRDLEYYAEKSGRVFDIGIEGVGRYEIIIGGMDANTDP